MPVVEEPEPTIPSLPIARTVVRKDLATELRLRTDYFYKLTIRWQFACMIQR